MTPASCDSGLASDDANLVLLSSSELGDGDKWMTSTTFDRYLYKLEAEQNNRQGCQMDLFWGAESYLWVFEEYRYMTEMFKDLKFNYGRISEHMI